MDESVRPSREPRACRQGTVLAAGPSGDAGHGDGAVLVGVQIELVVLIAGPAIMPLSCDFTVLVRVAWRC
jgi:hypothetical protein